MTKPKTKKPSAKSKPKSGNEKCFVTKNPNCGQSSRMSDADLIRECNRRGLVCLTARESWESIRIRTTVAGLACGASIRRQLEAMEGMR